MKKHFEYEENKITATAESSVGEKVVKRKHYDVIALAMLVLIVAAALIGLTFTNRDGKFFGTAENALASDGDAVEEVDANLPTNNTVLLPGEEEPESSSSSFSCSFVDSGMLTPGGVIRDGGDEPEVDPENEWIYHIDKTYVNENGDYVFVDENGKETVRSRESTTYASYTYDLDEMYGTAPVSDEDAMNKAFDRLTSNTAYAATISVGGGRRVYGSWHDFSCGSQTSSDSWKKVSRTKRSGSVIVTANISGLTWQNFLIGGNGVVYNANGSLGWSASGGVGKGGSWGRGWRSGTGGFSGDYGWSGTKTGNNNLYYVWYASAWAESKAMWASGSYSCYINNPCLRMYPSSTGSWTLSLSSAKSGLDWQPSRATNGLNVVMKNPKARFYGYYTKYTNQNNTTQPYYNQSYGGGQGTIEGGTYTLDPTSGRSTRSGVYCVVYSYAGNGDVPSGGLGNYGSTTANFYSTSGNLQIDNGNPYLVGEKVHISTSSGGAAQTTMTKASTLYFVMKVYDNGGYGTASGIKSIVLTSDRGVTFTARNLTSFSASASYCYLANTGCGNGAKIQDRTDSQQTYSFAFSPTSYFPNGKWSITITDFAGNKYTKSNVCEFYEWDGVAPALGDITVQYTATDSVKITGTPNWSNTKLNLIVTATDACNTTHTQYRDNAEIAYVEVTYTVKGESTARTVTNANFNKVISGTSSTTANTNGKYKKTCTYAGFRFDPTITTINKIVVRDAAGNETSKTSGISPTVSGRLDTIAPRVTGYSFSDGTNTFGANAAMGVWSQKNVTLTVKVKEYSTTEGGYYGKSGFAYNNASGIRYLYFYADSAGQKPLNIDGTNSNVKIVTASSFNTTEQSVSVTIKHDTANSAFNNNEGLIYVVAEDWCGNRSDGKNRPTAATETFSFNTVSSPGSTAGTNAWPGYYTVKGFKRDTFTPQIVVHDGSTTGTVIASTNSTNSTTATYVYNWTNATSRTIYVDIYYGCSGGTFSAKRGASDISGVAPASGYTVPASYMKGGTSVTSTSAGVISSPAGKTTTNDLSYTNYTKTVMQVQLGDKGETTYTFNFASGTSAPANATQVTIVNRIDYDPPTVTLKGFSTGTITNTAQVSSLIDKSKLLDANKWYDPGAAGLWAVFEVTDTGSGVLYNTDGVLANFNDASAGHAFYKFGKNGTSDEQKTVNIAKKYEPMTSTTTVAASNNRVGYTLEFRYDTSTDPKKEGTVYSKKTEGVCRLLTGTTLTGTNGSTTKFYVTVQMFDLATLKTLTSGSTSLYNSAKDTYNVACTATKPTYFRYKLGVTDFMGNVGYAAIDSSWGAYPNKDNVSIKQWDTRVLRFYVDPFTTKITACDFFEANDRTFSSTGINTANYITNNAKTYTLTDNRNDKAGWALNAVVCRITLATGISGYKVTGKYEDMTGKYNASGRSLYTGEYAAMTKSIADTQIIYSSSDGKTVWVLFEPTETKDIKVAVSVKSNNGSGTTKSPDNAYVRQDIAKPIIEKVFLSLKNTYAEAKNDILLSFDAYTPDPQNPNYVFALNESESKAYNASFNWIYTSQKAHLFIQATDKTGELEGSGIETVKINDQGCSYDSPNGTSKIYYGGQFGFTSITDTSYLTIYLADKKSNACQARFGSDAYRANQIQNKAAKSGATASYKVLPVVDTFDPYIKLGSTSPSMVKTAGFTQTDPSGASSNVYYVNGVATKSTSFQVTLGFSGGISGMTLYIRRKPYADVGKNRLSNLSYFTLGKTLPANYNFASNGWGYYDYDESVAISDRGWIEYYDNLSAKDNPYAYKKLYLNTNPATTNATAQTGSINLHFKLESVKESLEVIAVSGTGKYYIIEIGQLFIDSAAPVVHNGMTLFTVDSAADAASEIDYTALQKIWTEKVGQNYTNGTVDMYTYITDPASGINDNSVQANGTVLNKVNMKNVPVWTINGAPTTIRRVTEDTPTIGKNGKIMTINGYDAYNALTGEKILYVASPTVGKTAIAITYYRIKCPQTNTITVGATDTAGNVTPSSTVRSHTMNIDLSAVRIELKARTDSTDAAYSGYTGVTYTNKAVELRWRGDYGNSGFGGFTYTVKNNLNNTQTSKVLGIPQFNKAGTSIVMTYYPKGNNNTRNTVTLGSWRDGFVVKAVLSGGKYYWAVNGTTTSYEVNPTMYGDVSELQVTTWNVYTSYVYCFKTIAKSANRFDTYTVTTYNNVFTDYAVNRVRPTATATFNVKIDIDAPVIDMTSGNMAELSSTTTWHALAKSMRINVYDSLSGLAVTSRKLDPADSANVTEKVENVTVSYTDDMGVHTYYLIKDNDGFYRAYDLKLSGAYNLRNGLFYIEKNTPYTITVYDEAGNVTTKVFTPKIDETKAGIDGAVQLYVANSTATLADDLIYSQDIHAGDAGYYAMADWVRDIATNRINWADNYVYAKIKVVYGNSGFCLQYREATTSNGSTLTGSGSWKTVPATEYTVVESETVRADGMRQVTLVYRFAPGKSYNYMYYRFRAISNAQNTELTVYKSFKNSATTRGKENATSTSISIELEAYEARDKRYSTANGYATVDLSETKYTGLIAVDTVALSMSNTMTMRNGYNANGSDKYDAYGVKSSSNAITVADGLWSKDNVRMELTLASDSNFASGNVILYSSSTDGRNWTEWTLINPANGKLYTMNSVTGKWTETSTPTNITLTSGASVHELDSATTMAYRASFMRYTISDSRNNVLYKFKAITGAGLVTAEYSFGTYDGGAVHGIKVDTLSGEVQATASATFVKYSDSVTQATLAAEYNRQFATNGYIINEGATYTSKNTVIVRLQIQKVGYSGVKVYVNEGSNKVLLDTITYNQFVAEGGSIVYRYYPVAKNGETVQTIYLESIAGRKSANVAAYIRMDNTTPIVYVRNIIGNKATNWGRTDNLYTSEAEYWYTGEVTVNFGIGVIENNVFGAVSPYSGYRLEYMPVSVSSDWYTLNENKIILDGITIEEKAVYRFRIVSGAGMIYEIGGVVLNNEGQTTYSGQLNGATGDIKTASGNTPVTAHVIKNGTGDYDDGSFVYMFSVDSNTYYYDYAGRVNLGYKTAANVEAYDARTDAFTTYVTKVADSNRNFSVTSSKGFKRGDVITIEYTAKTNGVASGANHNYFQNYTVSSAYYLDDDSNTVETRRIVHNYVGDMFNELSYDSNPNNVKNLEKAGKITVQFEGNNINVVSYFIAEVDITYGKDKFYLQSEAPKYETTGATKYRYNDGANREVNVSLDYAYYNYFEGTGVTTPEKVGAYYVITKVTPNTGSFRVTNSTARKDFVLKYFTMENDTDNEFKVYNSVDFGYIDKAYYNLKADGTVDENVKSYLNSSYVLMNDIRVGVDLVGTYNGEFDGNGYTITVRGGTVTEDYGLFDTLGTSATVRNLTVKAEDVIGVNAADAVKVGVLAKNIDGGTVADVSVIADVVLNTFPAGSYFGGVAAYVNKGNIGNDEGLFTDIRVTNNGRALDSVYVGGVIGYMKGATKLKGVYAFGEIELYNVTDVAAGIVFGGAQLGNYEISVAYFDKNTFVNCDVVEGMSNKDSAVTVIGAADAEEYAFFATYSNTNTSAIGGTFITHEILTRLYSDFGYTYDGVNTPYGTGMADSGDKAKGPLVISTYNQILAINGYMNLNFIFSEDVEEIDMSNYGSTLAITKVFQGSLSTETGAYVRLADFAGNTVTYDKTSFGLFGQLDGTVENIIFSDLDIDFEYVGEGTLTAGIVAAKAYANAEIRNVIFVGTEKITAPDKTVEVGGVVGRVKGASINDVLSVNVMSVSAKDVAVGGMVAIVEEGSTLTLPKENALTNEGSVIILGRVEGKAASLAIGSAVGAILNGGAIVGGSKVFTIYDNVYAGGLKMEQLPIGSSGENYGIKTVKFSDDALRGASFASAAGIVFDNVFGTNALYPINGKGSATNPFVITNERDFGYINLILYADYRIDNNIEFKDFKTIGEGFVFSGSLKGGSSGDDISAEAGRIISLSKVTAPLVYYNSGAINDLSVNVEYEATVNAGETFKYGAIAIINDGEIKNVTVSGNVRITSATQDTTIFVSGFVAESRGGAIDADKSKLQNSISALNITVSGGGAVYAGGYAAIVTNGAPRFSYGIATGSITVTGAKTTYAGLLVGASQEAECVWILGEAASIDYTYDVTVDGVTIPKYDENEEPIVENFYGWVFGER